jgi:hypothetical protein
MQASCQVSEARLSEKASFARMGVVLYCHSERLDVQTPIKETKMYPGFRTNQQLAQIRIAEMIEEAAKERVSRQAQRAHPQASISGLTLAIAAALPIIAGIAMVVLTR